MADKGIVIIFTLVSISRIFLKSGRYVGAGDEESKVLWEFVQSTLREKVTGQIGISEFYE